MWAPCIALDLRNEGKWMGKGYAGKVTAWEAIAEIFLNCWYYWSYSNKIYYEREWVLQPSAWVELQDKNIPFPLHIWLS